MGLRPGPIAVGGGVVWVGNLDDRNLTRLNAESLASAGIVPLGTPPQTPTGLAVSPGGVWVAHGRLGTCRVSIPSSAR